MFESQIKHVKFTHYRCWNFEIVGCREQVLHCLSMIPPCVRMQYVMLRMRAMLIVAALRPQWRPRVCVT